MFTVPDTVNDVLRTAFAPRTPTRSVLNVSNENVPPRALPVTVAVLGATAARRKLGGWLTARKCSIESPLPSRTLITERPGNGAGAGKNAGTGVTDANALRTESPVGETITLFTVMAIVFSPGSSNPEPPRI